MPIKLERKISSSDYFYEVMLSPFEDTLQVKNYLDQYAGVYPLKDRVYKITYYDENGLPVDDS